MTHASTRSKTKKPSPVAHKHVDAFTINFVMKLGKALHTYGTPAHRLEEALTQVSQRLGIEAQFLSTPTSIMGAFGSTGKQQTSLIRIEPGVVDLGKMVELDAIANQVMHGTMSLSKGSKRIDAVANASASYPQWLYIICFGIASSAASIFFGGSHHEVLVSLCIGLLIGIVGSFAEKHLTVQRIFAVVSASMAAFVATLCAHVSPLVSFYVPLVAGLIWLMPGLTLTVAMTELATRNLVSGASRLTSAMMTFIELAFGVAIIIQLSYLLYSSTPTYHPEPLPDWAQWVALLLAAIAFTVLFRARPKDLGWIILAGFIGYGGSRLGAQAMGLELGAFFGALLVGATSNLYARWFNRPSAVLMVPGIVFLVPGSVGFRSVSYLLEHDVLTGIETAFSMVLVAVSLVAGLLVANVLIHPRKAL